jgi:hypothetical protein
MAGKKRRARQAGDNGRRGDFGGLQGRVRKDNKQ